MVDPPGTPVRSSRESGGDPGILVAVGRAIPRARCADNTLEKPSGLLLLAAPQVLIGAVDTCHFVRDRPGEFRKYPDDPCLGKPPHGTLARPRMDGDRATGGAQRVGHVRTAPAADEPVGRPGAAALFLPDWLLEPEHYRYQCDAGQLFYGGRGCGVLVVLVVDGAVSHVFLVVDGLWSWLLFRVDRICGCVIKMTKIMIMIMIRLNAMVIIM